MTLFPNLDFFQCCTKVLLSPCDHKDSDMVSIVAAEVPAVEVQASVASNGRSCFVEQQAVTDWMARMLLYLVRSLDQQIIRSYDWLSLLDLRYGVLSTLLLPACAKIKAEESLLSSSLRFTYTREIAVYAWMVQRSFDRRYLVTFCNKQFENTPIILHLSLWSKFPRYNRVQWL